MADLPDEVLPRELVEWMWGTGLRFTFRLSRGLENFIACEARPESGLPLVGYGVGYTMAEAVEEIREQLRGRYDNAAPF